MYNDIYQVLSDLFFAIYNVFRLFGDGGYKNLISGKTSHPYPRIRQLLIHRTLKPYMLAYHPEIDFDFKKADALFLNRMLESEKAYHLITGNKPNIKVFKPEYFANHPLILAMENNWKNNMRDKLLKYSFRPLAD